MATSEQIDQVEAAVVGISRVLRGLNPGVQGAALAEALAIWLVGHHAGDRHTTLVIRAELLKVHMEAVIELMPERERMGE